MNEQSTDELRLRATEAQMRRALGLGSSSPATTHAAHPIAPSTAHTLRRHFVRGGEVAVTVVHHDHQDSGANRLDEARQALCEQIAAREHAERQLQDAKATTESLKTQLAHERIAKEEAVQHAEADKAEIEQALQVTREELAAERQARHQAEQERDQATAGCQEAQERLRKVMAA